MWPIAVFRATIALLPIALLVQALLAGLALSGNALALDGHMFVGGATLLVSAAQASASILLWRSARIPGWPVASSIGLVIAYAVQMIAGRLHLFGLHLPLGMALFGASAAFFIFAWRWSPVQYAVVPQLRARRSAPEGHNISD
jgi:hypothetical protein